MELYKKWITANGRKGKNTLIYGEEKHNGANMISVNGRTHRDFICECDNEIIAKLIVTAVNKYNLEKGGL